VKTIALIGAPPDAEDVRTMLAAAGHEPWGYFPSPAELALVQPDIVVIDQPAVDLQAPTAWRSVEALSRKKSVLVFSDDQAVRGRWRRAGAYYVGGADRSIQELDLLVRRSPGGTVGKPQPSGAPILVGESPPLLALRRALQRLAVSLQTSTILVQGEPGSGRRTLARALHRETDPELAFVDLSSSRPFDAAPLPSDLAGGTIYLGDLGLLSSSAQAKLARVLSHPQAGRVTRFIGAMTIDARGRRQGDVRARLLNRFQVTLDVPPLRDRGADLDLLVTHLLERLSREHKRHCPRLSPSASALLAQEAWPGNVRQLEKQLLRALLLAKDDCLEEDHFSALRRHIQTGYRLPVGGVQLEALERDVLAQALQASGGNRTRAASLLGLTRDQVRYRVSKLGLENGSSGAERSHVA
jgi:DNA-binding NtrC family response regulator